ncbi:MAG TPA: hypothetical protein DCZ30_03110, partial [Clostridiales bacterium]|nr:hypothetical protein [Clostridiales bacterium]
MTYTIKVYNESDIKGKVAEITDYLPAGLEFEVNSEINKKYGWTATKNADGTTTLKTNYLANTEITRNQLLESLENKDDGKWFANVEVQCRVIAKNNTNVQYLTNRAEITASEDERGNKYGNYYTQYNNTDRDSVPNTIKSSLNLNNHYNDIVLGKKFETDNNNKYYPGYQDDDDFETVMLEGVSGFELNVEKLNHVNNLQFTDSIKFTIEEINPDIDISMGIIDGEIISKKDVQITGNGLLLSKKNVPINTEFRYRITEELPEDLKERYNISTREVIVKINVLGNGEIEAKVEKWNSDTFKNDNYFNFNVNNKIVTLSFENEPIAKYSAIIEKVDENGNVIKGNTASFKINNKVPLSNTNSNGIATIEENKKIENGKQSDKYSITEEKAPTGYGKFEGTITLNVQSKVGENNYEIDKENSTVKVTKTINGKLEEEQIRLNTMGEEVGFYIEDGDIPVIKLKIKNPRTVGKYSIDAIKVDENETPIKGNSAVFIVNHKERPTNVDGIATVVCNKNIATAGQIDLYDITEMQAPSTYVKFDGRIVLSIATKQNTTTNEYVIDKENSVVTISGKTKTIIDSLANFDKLNGDFPEDLEATVYIDDETDANRVKVKIKNNPEGKYNLAVEKVDENGNTVKNNIAEFDSIYNSNGLMSFFTGYDTGVANIAIGKAIISKEQKDQYEITEEKVPNGYIKFDGKVIVNTASRFEEGKYKLDIERTTVTVVKVVNGQEQRETIRLNTMGEEVGFYIENGDTPTIKIKIKNTKKTAKFGVQVIKIDGNGNLVKNNKATFTVNGTSKETNNEGVLEAAKDVEISESIQNFDYRMKETNAPEGFTLIKDDIRLNIWTKEENGEYKINQNTSVLQIGTEHYTLSELQGEFKEGKYVTAYVDEQGDMPVIKIKVKNDKKGKYNVELVKIDENGNKIKNNPAQFDIKVPSTDSSTDKLRSTNIEGVLEIIKVREILSTEQLDIYEITEFNAPEGFKKFDGKIKVTAKFKKENGELILDKDNTKVEVNKVVNETQKTETIKLNTMGEEVGFYIEEGNVPTIKIKVENPTIEGKYTVKLIKVDENGNVITNSPATFKISSGTEAVSMKTENGELYAVSKEGKTITSENQTDIYTIIEEEAPKGYIRFKGEIRLNIFARKEGDSYTLNETSTIDAGEYGVYSLSNTNKDFEQGKSVVAYLEENTEIPTIVIKIKNPSITGNFKLKLKKVNSISNKNIKDVVFSGLNYKKMPIKTLPTDENGITTIDERVDITTEEQNFIYVLYEDEVPKGYTKINNHDIRIRVRTKLSDDKESYVVKDVIVEAMKRSESEYADREKEMLDKGLTYDEENGVVTVTVPNEPTTDYSFEINKTDKESENVFVENARFTIDGPNGNIQTDRVIKNTENLLGRFLHQSNGVKINQTYTYVITETFAPIPYENIFKIGSKTMSIKVDIVIDENGKVDKNKSRKTLIVPEELNISEGENAKAYARAYECVKDLEFEDNTVKLNIENPKTQVNYKLDLFKHQLGNENEGIDNAKFIVKRKHKDEDEWEILRDTDNPLVSSKIDKVLIDERDGISVDNTYYYYIEEVGVPNSNYLIGKVKGATIKVSVSEMAEVNAEIKSVKLLESNETVKYNEAEFGNDIKLEVDKANNKFTLKMPNSIKYALELYKRIDKEGDNDYETVRGGKFKVYRVTKDTSGNSVAVEITPDGGTSAPWDSGLIKDANPNSSYEYWIEEIESPNELINDFENVTVQLILKTDLEGNVLDIGTGGSSLDFLSTTDKSHLPVKDKTLLYGKCKINVEDNRVQINLKDSPVIVEPEKYGIQIIKINSEKPQERLKNVEFSVLLYAGGLAGVQYDANSDVEGIQNPVTNENGIINIQDIQIIEGNTDLFRITEVRGLPEYKDMGAITLDVRVNLDEVTNASQIKQENITAQFVGDNASKYPEVQTNVTKGGIVQIIIPNEPNRYNLVINKKDEMGNLITADKTSNGSLEGAIISVLDKETNEYLLLNSVLEDGTRSRMINVKANSEYVLYIAENKAKQGYVNLLNGYIIELIVVTDENGNVKEIKQGDTNYTRYGLGETRNPHTFRYPEELIMKYIDIRTEWVPIQVEKNGETKEETVRQIVVDIKNPKAYSFRLTKLDTKGNRVEQVIMDATKVENGVESNYKVSLNSKSSELQQSLIITEGEEQVWRIREQDVNIPYYNILPDEAYIDVTVKCEEGKMKVLGYNAFDKNGQPINMIEQNIYMGVEAQKINGEEVIAIAIINPMQYIVTVNKVIEDIEGNLMNLHGAGIKVSALTPDRNGNKNTAETQSTNGIALKIHQIADLEKVYRYRIEEFSTPVGHKNVFEGKFVEFNVHFGSNDKPIVSDIGIYYNRDGERGELIPASDKIYDYIRVELAKDLEDDMYCIKAYVINPIEYDLEVTKVKTDNKNTELSGAEVKVNNVIAIRDGASSYKTTDTIKINEEKTYWIEEINSIGNHVNVLRGMSIKLTAKMKLTENNKEVIEIVSKEIYQNSGNKKVKLPETAENIIFNYVRIYPEKNVTTRRHTIKVIVENPVQYIVNLYKVKTDNKTGLYGANLIYNGKEAIKEDSIPKYQTSVISKVGEVRTFDIKELSTKEGYVNILEGDKTLRIKSTINNDEKLEILSTTIVETVNGTEVEKTLSEYEELEKYITVEKSTIVLNEVEYESIEIKVQNPREYRFRVAKLKSNGETPLKGAIIKVDGKVVMDGTQSTYEEINMLDIGESHTITIEENKTVAGNVNILKDKKLIITATVLPNENLSIDKKLVTNDEKQTEITDKNILKYFKVLEQTKEGNIKTLLINIINPEEYNLKIVKVDKDTKERMNDIKFDISVFDENNEEIKLKDSNTFKDKELSGLVTSNVDGENGIVKIENILIERIGTFKFKFHETPQNGYKSIEDIEANVTITEENGNYVVKSIEIIKGKEDLNQEETKVILIEPEILQIEAYNEKIKGKYDLIINKIDNYTKKSLDGAKFKVTIERDGKQSEIYKYNDDINIKDIVIPTEVEVKNGSITISDIRIDKPENYIIKLQEIEAPDTYLPLEEEIKLQITTDISGQGKQEKYVLKDVNILDGNNNGLVSESNTEDKIQIAIQNEQFDLSLRKSITKVISNEGKENEKITKYDNRLPDPKTNGLKDKTTTTAIYNHTKEPVRVYAGDTVIYTLRV